MCNKKVWIKVALLLLLVLSVTGCTNKYKTSYGYWSGVDNRDDVSYDVHITKDHIIMLEDKGATKYKYRKEKIGVRNAMVISGEELARHIEGLDSPTNSVVNLSLIDDDKDNLHMYLFSNMEGTLSDAQLYPVDKSDSPLSRVEVSGGSWIMLLIPIGLFLYLYKKRR